MGGGASAAETGPSGAGFFDIPAQPLGTALDAYAVVVGRDIYYDGALVKGRRSPGVTGMFTSDAALSVLLRGTGLAARNTGVHSFTITTPLETGGAGAVSALTERADYQRYFAAIQAGVRRVLRCSPETRSGSEQLLVRLSLTGAGAVSRVKLLSTTGLPERDEAFSRTLRRVRVDEVAPPGMPSSVTIMIFPFPSGAEEECGAAQTGGEVR